MVTDNEVDDLYDEPLDEEVPEGEPETSLDTAAARKLVVEYHKTPPGDAREKKWGAFTDEERAALTAFGVAGPVAGSEGEDFTPVTLDATELRRMDPEARRVAEEDFDRVTKQAAAEFVAGLDLLQRGELDAAQDTLDDLAEIRDQAARADPNTRSVLLQRGVRIVESLKAERREPFGRVVKVRQYFDGVTRRHMVQETDIYGNSRKHPLDRETDPEQFIPRKEAPFGDGVPTVEEFVSWDYRKRMRFANEHPAQFQKLKETSSEGGL